MWYKKQTTRYNKISQVILIFAYYPLYSQCETVSYLFISIFKKKCQAYLSLYFYLENLTHNKNFVGR